MLYQLTQIKGNNFINVKFVINYKYLTDLKP